MSAVAPGRPTAVGEARLLIDGRLTEARSGQRYANIAPATEETLGTVADAGVDDAAAAVAAARRAFEGPWRTMRASERGQILMRWPSC